ncbi:MAG: neutral/alkaline non-lysosomal ceramidase N-terminal domain-containing protein [Pirellulales bacterium]
MRLRQLCLLAILLGGLASCAQGAEAQWKAGVAKAVITPEKAVWLAGYGSKRVPDGKLHDLWMKALALEDEEGRRAVLVTSDFQGVPKGMSDRVFEELERKFGLERRQVMITFSHNHCGPRLGDDLVDYYPIEPEQVELVNEYTALMVTQLVAMVGEALADLAPARLQIGEGHTTFAVNRRNNNEADVPALLAKGTPLAGPVDHSVPVMTVTRPDGRLEAIVFGYACHPTTLSFLTWCGDYPGFAQLELEKNHPGATAMFVNTCGGDQNPLPRRTVELCQRYGHMLAAAVEQAIEQPLKPVSPGLRTAFEHVELPYLKVVTREDLHAALQDDNPIRGRWAARMLQRLDEGEKFPASYPYPVHAWRLGREMLVVGMGAETVVDYALRFKNQFGPGTWVCGYTDDMIAYIPSRRVWEEGGYEGGSSLYEYGRPAFRWAGDIEDRIAASVHKLVRQVSELPRRLIGYSELRTDLPGGRHANVRTMRAVVVEADGSRRRLLADELASEPDAWTQFAGWSPDGGTAIVGRGWQSPHNAEWEEEHRTFRFTEEGWLSDSYLVDLAGGQATNVTAVERVSFYNGGLFFWPNDPAKLGFTALVEGNSHPFRMDRDGRNKIDLTRESKKFTYGFSSSPDGKRIAYHQDYQVFLADADGSNAVQVETGQPFNFAPAWSPDGQWVLFVCGEHYNCHPHLVRADGSGLKKLADRGGYRGVIEFLDVPDFHGGSSDIPAWAADGKSIFYTAQAGQSVELFQATLDGASRRLTKSAEGTLHYHPQPSPDGNWLLLGSKRRGVRQLFVMRLADCAEVQITDLQPGRAAMWPHWQPAVPPEEPSHRAERSP